MQIAYGLTELSPICCQTQVDDPVDLRVSTIGKMVSSTEVGTGEWILANQEERPKINFSEMVSWSLHDDVIQIDLDNTLFRGYRASLPCLRHWLKSSL